MRGMDDFVVLGTEILGMRSRRCVECWRASQWDWRSDIVHYVPGTIPSKLPLLALFGMNAQQSSLTCFPSQDVQDFSTVKYI